MPAGICDPPSFAGVGTGLPEPRSPALPAPGPRLPKRPAEAPAGARERLPALAPSPREHAEATAVSAGASGSAPAPSPDAPHPPGERPDDRLTAPSPVAVSPRPAPPATATAGPSADGVRTAFGGAFFLVNLIERPDLAPPLPEAAQIGPWALLELLARALVDPPSANDSLWTLLARLDGREPGQPADAAAWASLAEDVPPLRARIGEAMALPAGEAVATFVRMPARVFAAPAHLDVMIPMTELRLPVRRAGLDLDPGWSPRFGRIIAFHYRD
jgi:hypothetical protein